MPTYVLLDTSLSMERNVGPPSGKPRVKTENGGGVANGDLPRCKISDLARRGVDLLLEHVELNLKLEHVAVCAFGGGAGPAPVDAGGFTRDVAGLRAAVAAAEGEGAGLLPDALFMMRLAVQEAFGAAGQTGPTTNIVLVTDGLVSGEWPPPRPDPDGHLDRSHLLPLPFRARLIVVLLGDPAQLDLKESARAYERLAAGWGAQVEVVAPEGALNMQSVVPLFRRVIQSNYRPYVGTLRMGEVQRCAVTLCPAPEPFRRVGDFDVTEAEVSDAIEVLGFLAVSEVSSPPVVSRHLVLPWSGKPQTDEDSRTPNLCVFLHGSLKVENSVAVVQVAENWFGLLFSCADTKKKSSLMLSLLSPGEEDGAPWLGGLARLGPAAELTATETAHFPVKTRPPGANKPSYSSSPVVWIKQSALHSDVQKILRHARKMPDKTAHFYKELNRLKRNALCTGFLELLQGLASTFDREATMLPATSHPDCALQLQHAAAELRNTKALELDYVIQPVGTSVPYK